MKKYIVVALIAGFAGFLSHGSVQADPTRSDYVNMDIVYNITYIQDHRTGICFAKYVSADYHPDWLYGGVSTVPCDQVRPNRP